MVASERSDRRIAVEDINPKLLKNIEENKEIQYKEGEKVVVSEVKTG